MNWLYVLGLQKLKTFFVTQGTRLLSFLATELTNIPAR
jgi:hypothetical protein